MTITPTTVTLTETLHADLGELVSAYYEAALEEVGDPEFAELIASTMVNELIIEATVPRTDGVVRAA